MREKIMVSVIIPAYNNEVFLVSAVESVLNQTYQDFEIIIIDDKSDDNTLLCAKTFSERDNRVKVISNPENLGVVQSRNKGFASATGEFIAFLDSDDLWMPEKLEKQIKQMEQKQLGLCYTAYSIINADGEQIGKTYHVPRAVTLNDLLKENVIGCSSVVIRHSSTERIKMREGYAHEDYVMWLELLNTGIIAGGIDEPLMLYRKTEQGRSFNKVNAAKGRFHIYRDFLGMSQPKSIYYFIIYAFNGLKKHFF
jgi:teichuronic acid biosynthesis glycosyltransferase TuaG